jgi:hypothetical protein
MKELKEKARAIQKLQTFFQSLPSDSKLVRSIEIDQESFGD